VTEGRPDAALNRENLSPTELFEEVCGGLIAIDPKRGTALPTHASIMYYLREFRESLFREGKEYIAHCVLSFLHNRHIAIGPVSTAEELTKRKEDVPLLGYASRFWGYHLNDLPVEAMGVARNILTNPQRRGALCQMLYASDVVVEHPLHFGPVHFVAYFHLDPRIYAFQQGEAEICDSWNQSPLHIACQQAGGGHEVAGGYQEAHGAPRQWGVRKLGKETFDAILMWSNQLAGQDRHGKTPLHYASMNDCITFARALLKRLKPREIGIRDRNDEDGRTPLDYAAQNGNLELVRAIHQRLGNSVSQDNGLWLAASHGHMDVVKHLLDDSRQADGGDRALFEASKNGHYDVAELLIESAVAEPRFKDPAKITALHHTSYAGNLALTRLLILEGADINATDKNGQSPLCRASEGGNAAIIKLLVEMGAEIDKTDNSGRSALDQAAENGRPEVLRYLLHHGARTNSSDLGGSSKHQNKVDSPRPRMSPLQISCKLGFEPNVVVLLEESAGPDNTAGLPRTPLSLACEGGHTGIIKLLLATGRVNINALDEDRRAPLSYAAQGGHAEVVKLLLADPYIDLEARDHSGRTALSYAAEVGSRMATRLLLHNLSTAALATALSAEDKKGKTPIDYAEDHKQLQDYMKSLLL
jgi:ankyrin repeat protein